MSFSLGGSVITQTGTDTDLSGLSGVSGVTVQISGAFSAYYVGNVKIVFSGTCTIDPRKERLVYGTSSQPNSVDVVGGGILNVGLEVSDNGGGTYYTKGSAIEIPSTSLPHCCADGALTVRSGGTLNWYGATILLNSCVGWIAGSTINISEGVMVVPYTRDTRIRCYSTLGTINGFEVTGNIAFNFFRVFPTFSGYEPVGGAFPANQIVSSSSGGTNVPYPFRDYDSIDVLRDWSLWRGAELHLINVKKEIPVLFSMDGTEQGLMQIFKEFNLTVTDPDGAVIEGAKYYLKDVNNGNRVNRIPLSGTDYDLLSDKIYTGTSNASGVFPLQTVLTAVGHATNDIDYRSTSNDWSSTFNIPLIAYGSSISVPKQNLTSEGLLDWSWILLEDLSITETVKATVDAYAQLENSSKFYDRAKSFLTDNYAGETATIVSREGTTINAGSYNVTIDATAGSAFAFDGSTITIKASRFVGDITTTGTFTLSNGAEITGTVTSSNQNFTTISVTFENLTDATVEVFDNTGTSVDRVTAQTGAYVYYTPSTATGTWSYVIDRIGYVPKAEIFNPSGSNITVGGAIEQLLRADGSVMYTGATSADISVAFDFVTPCMCIEIGDAQVDAQTIFNEAEQALVTVDGMRWQNTYGTLTRFDDLPGVGRILFMQDYIRLKRALVGDVNAGVTGYVQSTQGTPIDGANGSVAIVAGFQVSDVWSDTTRTLTAGTRDSEIDNILTNSNRFDGLIEDVSGDRFTAKALEEASAGGGGGDATLANQTQILSDIADLDAKVDIVDANVDAILVDTNELQLNQGDWLTATGFTVPGDLAPLATETNATLNKSAIITQGDTEWITATGFSTFDPANDTVAHVTLVDTTTTNTDQRGTDGANTVAPDNTTIVETKTYLDSLSKVNQTSGLVTGGDELLISKGV